MDIILDLKIIHSFWGSIGAAKRQAMREVANTGGVILDVCAIEVRDPSLIFVGSLPTATIEPESSPTPGRRKIRPAALGTFHTTWGALIRPMDSIGYFVLRQPLSFLGTLPPPEASTLLVAMEIERHFKSMQLGFIGGVPCISCNELIPEQRLMAIPGVRTCTTCQSVKEGEKK